MSLVTDNSLSSSLADAVMQVSMRSEHNIPVSCSNCLPLVFADNCQIQDSGLDLFVNPYNLLITGGTFVVSLSYGLYNG